MQSTLKPPGDDQRAAADSNSESIGLFQDIPRWIWITFMSGWVAVFGLFLLFFTNDGGSRFAVTVSALFAMMAFGLPIALAAQSGCGEHDCNGVVQTRSGPLSTKAAAVQIALIPIAAAMGLVVFITIAL